MKSRHASLIAGILAVLLLAACVASASHATAREGMTCDPATLDVAAKLLPPAVINLPISWEAWVAVSMISSLLVAWGSLANPSSRFFSTLPTRSPPLV